MSRKVITIENDAMYNGDQQLIASSYQLQTARLIMESFAYGRAGMLVFEVWQVIGIMLPDQVT